MKSLWRMTKKMLQTSIAEGIKDSACIDLCRQYESLNIDSQHLYIRALAREHRLRALDVTNKHIHQAISNPSAHVQQVDKIRDYFTPAYRHLFIAISRQPQGLKFLVDFRDDIFSMQDKYADELNRLSRQPTFEIPSLSSSSSADQAERRAVPLLNVIQERDRIQAMSRELQDLLSIWFVRSMFSLQRVTWNSPCALLHKISQLEAVHRIDNWNELKKRVGPYRRCYVLTHTGMAMEPVVILHVALTPHIVGSLDEITASAESTMPEMNLQEAMEDNSRIRSAMFYSITSPHRGLSGIDLGQTMIQSAVHQLSQEFPSMQEFCTLSNVTGFREWLLGSIKMQLTSLVKSQMIPSEVSADQFVISKKDFDLLQKDWTGEQSHKDCLLRFRNVLEQNLMMGEVDAVHNDVKTLLMKLCARYLCEVKHRGFALDRVANFHLKNGAVIWRINWLADMTQRGLSLSYGLMVNYRYYPNELESHRRNYQDNKMITYTNQIADLLL